MMISCTPKDRSTCIQIIAETFAANPSVNVVIGASGNKAKKLERLAEYSFVKTFNRKGAFLSTNLLGAALVYRSDAKGHFLSEQWQEVRFALSIGFSQVMKALRRESYIKKHRYSGLHYYFWFLGVKKGGGKAALEIRDAIFEKASKEQLPILLETSVWRNVQAYQRFGFQIYHEWADAENGITVWFMKKEC